MTLGRKHQAAIAAVVLAALALAFALRLALGPRWFSFYGIAAVVLVAVVPLTALVLARLTSAGRRRWPVLVLAAITLLAALAQIGFWLVFFHGGPLGLGLGVGRAMALGWIDRLAPWLAGALALGWAAMLATLPPAAGDTLNSPRSDRT